MGSGTTDTGLNMGIAALRLTNDDIPAARFTLHSHHLAKLDRFVAQAQRHATRSGGQFAGVAIEIDAAGAVSLHAAGLQTRML